jgi:hypothetical protein
MQSWGQRIMGVENPPEDHLSAARFGRIGAVDRPGCRQTQRAAADFGML